MQKTHSHSLWIRFNPSNAKEVRWEKTAELNLTDENPQNNLISQAESKCQEFASKFTGYDAVAYRINEETEFFVSIPFYLWPNEEKNDRKNPGSREGAPGGYPKRNRPRS